MTSARDWLQVFLGLSIVLFTVTAGAALCVAADLAVDHRAFVAWFERVTNAARRPTWLAALRVTALVLMINGECRAHRVLRWRPSWPVGPVATAVGTVAFSYRRHWNQPTGSHRLGRSTLLPSSEVIQNLIAERNAHAHQDLGN